MCVNNQIRTIGFVLLTTLHLFVYGQNFPAPSVNVIVAEKKILSPSVWVSGTVVSRNNSQLAAEVSGRLISLAELGALVKKDDVIAKIDDETMHIQLREDVANVESIQARLAFLESEVKRKTVLSSRNLSSITDLDETISQRNVVKGDLKAAKARLAKTQQNLNYSQLKAPFDGMVAERLSNQGEYINAGKAIVRLVETANVEASVFVPLTAYRYLKQVDTLTVDSPMGKGDAVIKALVPVADNNSHLMEVRLDMSALDWPIGLSIRVAVATGEAKEVLVVPRDALVLRRDGTSVFRVSSENIAQQIPVTIGVASGELIEVIGDVNAGDHIVIRGAETIMSGQTVVVKTNNQQLFTGQK